MSQKQTKPEDEPFRIGMQIKDELLGAGAADERYARTTDFNRPFEDLVTRYCFGETWSRPGLDRKTRSLITLAALTAMVRPNQLKVHVRAALNNGATREEISEVLVHTAVYAGVPAGVEAFTAAEQVLAEIDGSRRET